MAEVSLLVETFKDSGSLYAPLLPRQVRILKLHGTKVILLGGSKDSRIHEIAISCSLEVVSLDEVASGGLSCNALSYVWGPVTARNHIIVNGVLKSVTGNLHAALYNIIASASPEELPYPIWVDAVCIDQDNMAEKIQQINMMGDIYSQVPRVLVWLGAAVEMASPEIVEFWDFDREASCLSKAGIAAVATFLERCDWFRRAWTFQEICLAKEASVVFERTVVPWKSFCKRIESVSAGHTANRKYKDTWELTETIRRVRRGQHRSSLLSLLLASGGRHASDPRDRIFSLLGIYSNAKDFDIMYTQSLDTIYAKTSATAINEAGYLINFFLIDYWNPSIAGLLSSYTTSAHIESDEFLSWIPNWNDMTLEDHRKGLQNGLISEASRVPMNSQTILGAFKPKPVSKKDNNTRDMTASQLPVSGIETRRKNARRTDSVELLSVKPELPRIDYVNLHSSFTMCASLRNNNLVIDGALIGRFMRWWQKDQDGRIEAVDQPGQQLMPDCVTKLSFEPSEGSNRPVEKQFLSPDVYRPVTQTAQEVFLQIQKHEKAQCQCERGQKRGLRSEFQVHEDPRERNLWCKRYDPEVLTSFIDKYKHCHRDKGVLMVWVCVLYGSSNFVQVAPAFDEASGELICHLIRRRRPRYFNIVDESLAWVLKDQGSYEDLMHSGIPVSEWRTPDDVFRFLVKDEYKAGISWVPVRMELSGRVASKITEFPSFNLHIPTN